MFGLWIVCTIGFASPALADTQGQSQTFYVNPTYDATGATVATATLRAVGVHAYFYVDDRYWNALSSEEQSRFTGGLTTLATQFDTATYPLMTSLWGFENSPGIDGDPHVVILLQRLVSGSGGYFETIHNYTKDHATGSNAREMIYVNADSVLAGSGKSFIAHEFQHLISFNQKELVRGVQDDVWVNEARSEYSLTVAGFSMPFEGSTLQRRLQAFLRSPSDSLVEWLFRLILQPRRRFKRTFNYVIVFSLLCLRAALREKIRLYKLSFRHHLLMLNKSRVRFANAIQRNTYFF
jgi:hypothetical protein